MSRSIRAVLVFALVMLCLVQSRLAGQERRGGAGRGGAGGPATPPPPRPQPQRTLRIEYPPLFFREDWKLDPKVPNVNTADEPEHMIGQGDVANPNLEVRLYGDKEGTRIADQTFNSHMTYAMTLLCTSNCAITLRDRNNDVDLSGVATIKWRTRVSGFHLLRPILKLADGRWLIGDKATGLSTNWVESEIQLVDVRWRNLDIENVVEARDGYWVDFPDLTRVEEIGFTDLMRGSGHGSGGGSRIDWIEVYGKRVPRAAASQSAAAPRRSIEQVSGGVYTATNNNHRTVFLVTPEGIVLADPINADFSRWLKAELAARFKVPVKYVVYSHHHWDHASGGEVFADTARFVGHANMLTHLALPPPSTTLSQVVGQYQPVAKLDANRNGVVEKAEAQADTPFDAFDANRDGVLSGAEVVRGPVSFVRPPDITYTDKHQITLGGKRVEISWVGRMNHSQDSSFIAFPDDSVLFLVDFISFRRLPNREMDYEDGQFQEWMTAIGKAEALAGGFKQVVTGHGPVGTVKDITAWRVYFEKLRTAVAAGIAKGQTLEQMQRDIKMAEYSHWDGFDWVPLNVLGMYHFLTDSR